MFAVRTAFRRAGRLPRPASKPVTRNFRLRVSFPRHNITRRTISKVSNVETNVSLALGTIGLLGAGGVLLYTIPDDTVIEEEVVVEEVDSEKNDDITVAKKFEHPLSKMPWYMQFLYKVKRMIFLACLFMPCTAVSLAAYLTNDQRVKTYCLDLLVRAVESAGCTFQKYGQWVSTRPDMFPEALVNTMKKLCTDSPKHSEKRTRETFKQSFGVEIEDIFDEFDMNPVASGSVAQVYRAKLKPEYALEDGTLEVAVKVRHPHTDAHGQYI